MKNENMKNLLGLRNLKKDYIEEIFKITSYYKKKIENKICVEKILDGKSVINLFFESSTRTQTSFELSEKMLGMNVVNFSKGSSSMNKGESLLDTLKTIESMKFDFLVVRHQVPGVPYLIEKYSSSKIINAGDGTNEHPTQGLLDIYTLKEEFGELKNLNVCIMGNISHSRVAKSNIFGLKQFDANISVCGPIPFIPRDIEGLGVNVMLDTNEAVKKSDALILLRVQMEREAGTMLSSLSEYNRHYGITMDRIKSNPEIKILHPGPMNINVEIDYETSVMQNSMVLRQVTNGLAVKCALFKIMNESKVK
ncbi:MAG: Aspartate carbamoyltransferase [Ignavibacteria bacterium]|nr:Aspartate carbamoyltransferase [Ignavibacteria bacterium]